MVAAALHSADPMTNAQGRSSSKLTLMTAISADEKVIRPRFSRWCTGLCSSNLSAPPCMTALLALVYLFP